MVEGGMEENQRELLSLWMRSGQLAMEQVELDEILLTLQAHIRVSD